MASPQANPSDIIRQIEQERSNWKTEQAMLLTHLANHMHWQQNENDFHILLHRYNILDNDHKLRVARLHHSLYAAGGASPMQVCHAPEQNQEQSQSTPRDMCTSPSPPGRQPFGSTQENTVRQQAAQLRKRGPEEEACNRAQNKRQHHQH